MQPFPRNIDSNSDAIVKALQQIARYRDEDITDRNTLPAVFISGRTVGKIPSSSTDISATDRVGDISFAVDGSYIYYCVNASGTAKWRRIALATW